MKLRYKFILTIIIILISTICKIQINFMGKEYIALTTGNYVSASETGFSLGDVFKQGRDWLNLGKDNTNKTMDTRTIDDVSGRLYNIFFAIAFVLSVIVGAILAIQIMTSSIEKKADAKQGLIPYAISCIVAFGALGIWKLVIIILKNFNSL